MHLAIQPQPHPGRPAVPSWLHIGVGPVDRPDIPARRWSGLQDRSYLRSAALVVRPRRDRGDRMGANPVDHGDCNRAKGDVHDYCLPQNEECQDVHGGDRSDRLPAGYPMPTQQSDKRARARVFPAIS
jgi:hypothetical protein